ncbi:hypothetical protein ACHOLT_00405 [Desulfitobacterium sp. Sab5]|uniref:hypothetical protein n=1 Tax=Desulfitobacterium nosdiversum TaxID=3375356 RepID=UPI003CF0018E
MLILTTLLSGCGNAGNAYLDNALEPSLKTGMYIQSFDGATSWNGTPLATAYPVSSKEEMTYELTKIWFQQDLSAAASSSKGNGYLIKVIEVAVDKNLKQPKIQLVNENIKTSFINDFATLGEFKRSAIVVYEVKMDIPEMIILEPANANFLPIFIIKREKSIFSYEHGNYWRNYYSYDIISYVVHP